jgi:hypothetical protein
MLFLYIIPFFLLLAYFDYKQREIPHWLIAATWLIYGMGLVTFPIGQELMIFALFCPIFGLGYGWLFHLLIEETFKKKWLPRGLIRHFRFGLADFFILPLMLPVVWQFGQAAAGIWLILSGGLGLAWSASFLDKKGWQYRHGIPFLTFATIALLLVSSVVQIMVANKLM